MHRHPCPLLAIPAALAVLLPLAAQGAAWEVAGGHLDVQGSVHFGTVNRASARDPELVPGVNAALVGAAGAAVGGKNQDDGNLNYNQGAAVSTAIKGSLSLRWTRGAWGVRASLRAWNDIALEDNPRPFGHVPNGFAPNQPLTDQGFVRRARFSGAVEDDVHLFGRTTLGTASLDWKLGTFKPDWGQRFSFNGGLNDLTPRDLPAQRRAGALPEEGTIAMPGVTGRLTLRQGTQVEAFIQTGFRANVASGCGTFFAQVDFVAEGCDKALLGVANDRTSLANGVFVKRSADQLPSDAGQFGMALRHTVASIGTQFGLHAAQFHSRAAYFGATRASRTTGAPFVARDPDGLNGTYFIEYPERIRIVGLTAEKKLAAGSLLAELTYRPNQPFQYNAVDLLNAFGSATAATPLRAAATATPLGGAFHGYERHKAVQLNLAAVHALPGFLGAAGGTAAAEVLAKHVPDLPDPAVMRFRRSDVYGSAPVGTAACPATASARTCSLDGYVSASALAYRLRLGLRYPQLFDGVDLLPTLTFGHDVKGWSEDGAVSEGRRFAILSLRVEVNRHLLVEAAWQPTWGGAYNNLKDRDTMNFSVGHRF